jgi:hypothetical protein
LDEKHIDQLETNDGRRGFQETSRAKAFLTATPHEAVATHPELAGAFAVVESVKKEAQANGLSGKQLAVVVGRTQETVVSNIQQGKTPTVSVKDEVKTTRQVEINNESQAK